jgi:hypothetical protein
MTPYDPAPYPIHKRSGSQKRQRKQAVKTALNDEEMAQVEEKAQACGLSLSSYGRAAMLGTPGPRAQRMPHVNAEVMGRATAALNKIGNVVNQMAHVLNAGGSIAFGNECAVTLAEIRAAARAIREATGRKDRDDSQRQQA